jgi:hypothetical protein
MRIEPCSRAVYWYWVQRLTIPGSGAMKRVPAEEFAEHAAEYLAGSAPVSVEKDGEVIGQYVPTPNGRASNGTTPAGRMSDDEMLRELEKGFKPQALALIRRLDRQLQQLYERAGLTEEEFANLYDSETSGAHKVDQGNRGRPEARV